MADVFQHKAHEGDPVQAGFSDLRDQLRTRPDRPALRDPGRQNQLDTRLAHILDVTSDAIAALDREWNVQYLNQRARQLLGASEDIAGKNLWRELMPRGAGGLEERLRRTMQDGI